MRCRRDSWVAQKMSLQHQEIETFFFSCNLFDSWSVRGCTNIKHLDGNLASLFRLLEKQVIQSFIPGIPLFSLSINHIGENKLSNFWIKMGSYIRVTSPTSWLYCEENCRVYVLHCCWDMCVSCSGLSFYDSRVHIAIWYARKEALIYGSRFHGNPNSLWDHNSPTPEHGCWSVGVKQKHIKFNCWKFGIINTFQFQSALILVGTHQRQRYFKYFLPA